MQEVSSCLKRLFAAWTLEVDSPLSLHLRKAAHERGDRTAWQQLQWREIAYRQGVDGCKAVRVQLAKKLARFLDSVRRCARASTCESYCSALTVDSRPPSTPAVEAESRPTTTSPILSDCKSSSRTDSTSSREKNCCRARDAYLLPPLCSFLLCVCCRKNDAM